MPAPRTCTECSALLADGEVGPLCAPCTRRVASAATVVRDTPAPTLQPASDTTRFPDGRAPALSSPVGLPRGGERFGPYRVVRELGSGGMGSVFEAEEVETGRRLALKVLSHSLDSAEMRKRFLREGRLAASVSHPNSVYVYGTEEIDGMPTISMELLPGGTLHDRVAERGPLPVGESVDAILDVIAGLEAAERVGVLHRDIKPTNCFVDADGRVKVGDFGLSVSVAVRVETQLTTQGTFLGTPAYSSPEQLRGDELDLRADIYSVGVTLYYLLTARVPFDADNMVKLISAVLERPPEPPDRRRADLPRGVSKVVLRCLEKQPEKRFASYEDLRRALLPYASASPTAATLGLRVLAGLVDLGAITLPLGFVQFLIWGTTGAMERIQKMTGVQLLVQSAVSYVVIAAWFAIPEARFGASLGKALCGLRVVRANRSSLGMGRAAARALFFIVVPALPSLAHMLSGNPMQAIQDYGGGMGAIVGLSYYVLLALLFATARRRNGFASLHDLATGVRVIRAQARQVRPVLSIEGPQPPRAEALSRIGPYDVLGTLGSPDGTEWLVGSDPRLGRKVWIRRVPPQTPAVVGGSSRAGRLRWLNGRRTEDASWDAFECPGGAPLVGLLDRPREWASVRYWIADLGEEIVSATKDGSLPEVLTLDRVWVSSEGVAKLLDFPAPGAAEVPGPRIVAHDPSGPPVFLAQVARSAIEGRVAASTEALEGPPARPLPTHARTWLQGLPSRPLTESMEALAPLLRRNASVTWRRRLAVVAACAALPAMIVGCSYATTTAQQRLGREAPDVMPLLLCLRQIEKIEGDTASPPEERARASRPYEVCIAGRLRRTVEDPAVWSGLYARSLIPEELRLRAERIVAQRPLPTEEEIHDAEIRVGDLISSGRRAELTYAGSPSLVAWAIVAWMMTLFLVALPSVLWALLGRRGAIHRVSGIDFARPDGRPVRRWRVALRQVVTWSPLLLPLPFWIGGNGSEESGLAAAAAVLLLGAAWSILSARSLQDRIAGTRVVPA